MGGGSDYNGDGYNGGGDGDDDDDDDDGDGGVAICFARSTPDLLALMKAFALSINSPVLQKVPSIHI